MTNVLQPNPSNLIIEIFFYSIFIKYAKNILDERLEDFLLTKLDRKVEKPNNLEILGLTFLEAGHEIGTLHPYGNLFLNNSIVKPKKKTTWK